jgi:predicted flavoprotein YhiN
MNNAGDVDADVGVIGGGAAGLMAAGRAAEAGARVLLLEKSGTCGRKILISGKSRCNLTNAADTATFISMYGPNGRFLHGVFSRFFRPELLAFFERHNLATRVERGGRIFPASGDAGDVVHAFQEYLTENKVRTIFSARVNSVIPDEQRRFAVETSCGRYLASCVILATGGASWPATGSTGDGYPISAALDHTIVKPRPALVPLIVREQRTVRSMQHISLRNVRAAAFQREAEKVDAVSVPNRDYGRGEKKIPRPPLLESRFGEMNFTPFGLGGPIILLMSLAVVYALETGPVSILIDLKPALTKEQLRKRFQADLNAFSKKGLRTILKEYLPLKMIDPFLGLAAVEGTRPGHRVSAGERERMIDLFKALRFNIQAPLPLAKAIVTAGGVALDEIDPRTMASKKLPGLYFCGEVMDIDADTGGYNLQAAFSTGYVAGESAACFVRAQARH